MTTTVPAREVKPGMHIRRPEAVSTSPYAAFREVARTHNVGIYSQIDIEFTDGTGDTWTLDAEFEVQSDAERATDVAVATVYARLADAYRVPPAADLPDYLTGDDRAHAENNERRWQVIAGLRNLAQMLADHPELPTPAGVHAQVSMHGYDPEAERAVVLDAATALGEPLFQDGETAVSVKANLGDIHGPSVEYVVYAAKPKPAPADDECGLTQSHTREVCGNPNCRES